MAGYSSKRHGKKAKVNPKGFKKAFSFKQQEDGKLHHHHGAAKPKNRITASDDGVLVFPAVQRLTETSPPLAIIDGIPGLKQQGSGQHTGLSLVRRRSSSRTPSASAPPALQTRSPYESKKAQKSLPATLKNCRRSRPEMKDATNYSAWERRQPIPSSRGNAKCSAMYAIAEAYQAVDEPRFASPAMFGAIEQADSSNSLFLPPEVSPANKFIPIGYSYEEDDISFASENYDICKEGLGEEDQQDIPLAAPATVAVHARPDEDQDDRMVDKYDFGILDKYSCSIKDLPPSPVATDDTSSSGSFGYRRRRAQESITCQGDRYCVELEHRDDLDWFPYVKQEVMKLSSRFMSNCGAADHYTS